MLGIAIMGSIALKGERIEKLEKSFKFSRSNMGSVHHPNMSAYP